MNSFSAKTVVLASAMLLVFSGCHKKKEATLPPPQSQAPTVEAPQEPAATTTAPTQPATKETTPPPPTTTTPSESAAPSTATTTKPKPKPRKPRNQTKPAGSTNGGTSASTPSAPNGTQSQSSKVVVQQGGEQSSGQISAAGPDDDSRSLQTIEELLQSTDSNLRSISRQLSDNELAMVEQIRTYMAQARTATTDGDLTRANNLALKAHLLSDELVKR